MLFDHNNATLSKYGLKYTIKTSGALKWHKKTGKKGKLGYFTDPIAPNGMAVSMKPPRQYGRAVTPVTAAANGGTCATAYWAWTESR